MDFLFNNSFDMTTLNLFQGHDATYIVGADNTYEDLFNVSGKGYLTFCIIQKSAAGTGGLKITVDGSVMFEGVNSYNTRAIGIINTAQITQYTSGAVPTHHASAVNPFNLQGASINAIKELPHTDATEGMSITSTPIWFNTSLRIEVKYLAASNLYVYYEGAYV